MMLSLNVLLSLVFTVISIDEPQCLLAKQTIHSRRSLNDHRSNVSSSMQQSLRSSEQLGMFLVSASKQPGVTNETTALLRSFRPCAECKQHSRYGERNDGGYVMCDDDIQPGQLKAAYSYGINGFDGWANDISQKFKIPVFEYDCTNPKLPQKCPTCDLRFNLECMNSNHGKPREKFATLTQQLQRNGHSQIAPANLLLKVDIEGAEWAVFAEEPAENLKKFREVIVEFHNLDQVSQHQIFLQAVSNILGAGFVVEHIHGNNFAGQAHLGSYMIPKVLEVTYLQRPSVSSKCLDHSIQLPQDGVNNVNVKELAPAKLPMS